MNIFYCDKCSFRIPDHEIQSGAVAEIEPGRYVCAKCNVVKRPSTGAVKLPDIQPASNITRRSSTQAKARSSARSADAPAPNAAASSKGKVVAIAVCCVAVLVPVVVLFALRASPARVAESSSPAAAAVEKKSDTPKPPDEPKPSEPPKEPREAPAPPPATPASLFNAEPRSETSGGVDIDQKRRDHAQRLLDEAKADFKSNPEDAWTYKEQLDLIALRHATTPAGEEARKLAASVKVSPQLLKDGGFESGKFEAWENWQKSKTGLARGKARSGKFCGKVGPNSGFGQRIKLKPKTTYVVTAWIRSDDGESVGFGVKEYGGADLKKECAFTDYTLVSQSFTTGEKDNSALVYVWKHQGSKEAFIDDVRVVEEPARK